MTLQEFINKWNGKKLDYDGAYQNQCVDLYRFYLKEVWQKPQTPGVVGAYQIMNTLPVGYDKFYYPGNSIPRIGDVIIWNQNLVKNGHVAVVTAANAQTFDAFQQNAPIAFQAANTARYSYKHVIGWFRPHLSLTEDNMHRAYNGTIYALIAGYWVAITTSGEEYKVEWNVNTFPPVMTEAQFKAFPVHKRVIK